MVRIVGLARKNRRRDHRRDVRLAAFLNDFPVEVLNVGLGGMALGVLDTESDAKSGPEFVPDSGAAPVFVVEQDAVLRLVEDDRPSISLGVEIARVSDQESIVAVRFFTLTDEQYRIIERLVLGRRDSRRRATR